MGYKYICVDGKSQEEVLDYLLSIGCTQDIKSLLYTIYRAQNEEYNCLLIHDVSYITRGSKKYFNKIGYTEVQIPNKYVPKQFD